MAEQAEQLCFLAREFEALQARVRDVSYTPGTYALRQISPLLLRAQDLTATTLVRLGALDGIVYADTAGSRASLECLSSVMGASALAGNDLASALYATADGTRVSIAAFRALAKRGLVARDTSTSLFRGHKITVTEQGQQALAKRCPAATPATNAPKPPAVQEARR
ncbi:hypothetical protein [Streptomyces sp. NPDC058280]|uniref:hypothetical protein n=1 Tax=Streptomyces sp. NPDC058280 TaxID=3346419 RepID=UPI0036E6B800